MKKKEHRIRAGIIQSILRPGIIDMIVISMLHSWAIEAKRTSSLHDSVVYLSNRNALPGGKPLEDNDTTKAQRRR